MRRYLDENFTPDQVAEITWAPAPAIVNLARDIARNRARTLFPVGMGPNQFFNADLKDRAIFLVAALSANIGQKGGNVGSFAGNYRAALFNGLPQYIGENPFDIETDPAKPARVRIFWKGESAHYMDSGDRPLRVGNTLFTGKTHMPAPTKAVLVTNSNSILGNAKGAYDVIANTLPKIELWATSEWWWTMTCEYSDIVFPVDAWNEFKLPDMCCSVTNPFLTVYPRTPHRRMFDTRSDVEVPAGISAALARLTGDRRFLEYWRFVHEGRVEAYLNRILGASNATRGYRFEDLERQAQDGIPALMMTRTTPRQTGWEQTQESRPWYTKTGRLEFYREEDEFITLGENLLVYKEPVEATFYQPSVIVAKPHPAIRAVPPDRFGIAPADYGKSDVRQVLTLVMPWADLKKEASPLVKAGYPFIFHTPKYRHGAHTTGVDTDFLAMVFGPFSDVYRRDKRMPFLAEGYADINPADAKALGLDDGDYIWVDGWGEERPYRGWKPGDEMYQVSRLMCRVRYYPGTPRGVARMWFNMYGASHGTVKGQATRPDGLAKNPATNYQAMFRHGSHQSVTRAWLRPTLSTDSLVRKELFGQLIGKGFLADVHTVIGAPRESMAKFVKAEEGGIGGKGLWHPAHRGYRPTYENEALKKFLRGDFVVVRR
jgi:nitrate reductase alpha subunit